MSYIKLDTTRINYLSTNNSVSTLYLSEIIDSDCSYKDPILITSIEELTIYFGTSFTQREYYEELLSNGISLLLYKPIKGDTYGEPLIDTSVYKEIIEYPGYPEEPREKDFIFFDNLPENGLWEGETNWKFYISTENAYYIWYEGEYINIENIPTEEKLSSTINRDTLRLIDKSLSNGDKFSYCHPKYSSREIKPEYTETIDEKTKESLIPSIYSHGVNDDHRSVGFILDFSEVKEIKEKDYLVFPLCSDFNYPRIQFYFGKTPPLGSDIITGGYSHGIEGDTLQEKIENIAEDLKDYGYNVIKYKENVYKIFTSDMIPDQKFFSISGLKFEKDFELTQNIYSILSENNNRAEFFSKTIGPGDEDIKVKVEKITGKELERYRITISRYSYTEIFEGPLYLEAKEDEDTGTKTFISLEKIINLGSNLVEVKFYNQGRDKNNPKDGLNPGEYKLSRAISEKEYTPEDYWRSLEKLREFNLSEDFLLVPDIYKYVIKGATIDQKWIYEYEKLLDYAKEKNCQVLIANNPWKFGCSELKYLPEIPENPEENIMYGIIEDDFTIYQTYSKNNGWKIYNNDPEHKYRVYEIKKTFEDNYTGNHIFNYTEDKYNRLVYFYKDIDYLGHTRPAYYVFLSGILSGEYSKTIDDIIYDSPVLPYEEEESDLKKWKSNFLSCNEHFYYYKEFFNHTGDWEYESTILSRFSTLKVTNTVSREFPYYLGLNTSEEILKGINNVLNNLKLNYPIIHSLNLSYIEEDTIKQTVSVYLDLQTKELLEKDIKLSVTLNFNNTN